MTNKLIFPFLIILFSIIIIYGIFNIKYNNKFLTNIEKFQNNYLESNKNNIKNNILNGQQTTIDFANGNWSWYNSTVNLSDYTVSNMLTINANSGTDTSNLGTIKFTYENEIITYKIVSILNGTIIAAFDSVSIQISFTNIFTDSTNINPPYNNITNIPNAIVTFYLNQTLFTKFTSYKIYNNTVGGEIYGIISSNDIYIDSPPPTFDFATYDILVGKYKYPSKYISLSTSIMGGTNNNIGTRIQKQYLGNLQFSIKRIFKSPAKMSSDGNSAKIITTMSNPIQLKVRKGYVPSELVIVPFEQDKEANNLSNFFEPYGTIVYFYQYINKEPLYYFSNEDLISHPAASVLKYKNNANSMFEQNISYNQLNTVTKDIQYSFQLVRIPGFFPSTPPNNINSPTIIPFSVIANFISEE